METTKLTKGRAVRKVVGGYFETEDVDFSEVSTLDFLQEAVNGYIEPIRLPNNVDIWLNEEGKINGMKPNTRVLDKNGKLIDVIFGDLIVLGCTDEGDTVPLNDEQFKYFVTLIKQPTLHMKETPEGEFEAFTLGNLQLNHIEL